MTLHRLAALLAAFLALGAQSAPQPQEPTTEELIKTLLAGDKQAAGKLRARGGDALPALAQARLRDHNLALRGLYSELKLARWEGESAKAVAQKLKSMKMDVSLKGVSLDDALAFVRDFAGVNLVPDPGAKSAATADLALTGTVFETVLDVLTLAFDLDYDFRYGVLWISTPQRLWAPPKPERPPAPITDAQAKTAREWIATLGSEAPEERDRASAELKKLGVPVLPILEEGLKSKDTEIVSRCRALIETIRPRPGAGALPPANAWATRDLKGEDKAIADKLAAIRITIDMQNAPLPGVIDYIRELSGLNIVIDTKTIHDPAKEIVKVKVTDVELSHALELITLPEGLDVTIEKGLVIIFAAKK